MSSVHWHFPENKNPSISIHIPKPTNPGNKTGKLQIPKLLRKNSSIETPPRYSRAEASTARGDHVPLAANRRSKATCSGGGLMM